MWYVLKLQSMYAKSDICSLVPRLLRNAGRAWYLFSCEHDVIGIRPEVLEQKANVCVVHVFNALCVWYLPPTARYV